MALTIDLDTDEEIFLDTVDVEVTSSETIYFKLEGNIKNVDENILQEFIGESVKPKRIVFERK